MRELYPHPTFKAPLLHGRNSYFFSLDGENGYGKRTDVDAYRLQSRGGKGVINMKANFKAGKVVSIRLVDDTTKMMVISQFGKIIRIDTKSVGAAGRSTSGGRLLNLEFDDKVASAAVIPPEDPKTDGESGTLVQ